MKKLPIVFHKKILVLGLAKSGTAAAETLHDLGAFVTVNDSKPFEQNENAQYLLSKGLTVICGSHPEDLLDEGFSLIVKNPGIPYTNPVIAEANKRGIPVWTEVELAYRISDAPMIGITGSNGKTTTTTLIFEMLAAANKEPKIAGNIGTVATSVAKEATADNIIVTELSSFQLMGTEELKPKISVLLNLYEAHLDYHKDFQEYTDAKYKITQKQDATDWLVFNGEQQIVKDYAQKSMASQIPFYVSSKTKEGISADDLYVYWNGEPLFERSIIALRGKHNLENVLAATATALTMNCSVEAITNVLSTFHGVKHRTQFIREWKGRKFYNDSKATNALATKSALEGFTEPVILIAGGVDRGHSFDELIPYLNRVKALVHYGATKDRLQKFGEVQGIPSVVSVQTLGEAFEMAIDASSEGDIVLLSPACASWDQYESFEIRGEEFIDRVISLEE
ncbi:UDP-N-acetylmuramoyl-L-alanine--D-glutamate ligase [Psychrobacillus sp. INOP01]|uniref:UDP-N-acetylmuramoyl-L-alanine--D-glutamate ligase n=1 Tax=Psychrobacillus sp. INOP01 TaxID=2829187 RepID=UPI001BAAE491|nr:UDP-N-acetylmuramoyl-L-alanine--D-glutamate ligase [Psychrobacillus sp. INOP01]QUG41000.1 UDP-N-acetylmuramoyl-L-alanine--D-glutamate ligase [Psychrobacillus sp. INOP01]